MARTKAAREALDELGAVLPAEFTVDHALLICEKMAASGVPQEQLDRVMREARGGKCPLCEKPYTKRISDFNGKQFRWWGPQCECEDREAEKKAERDVVREALVRGNVPAAYLDATFDTWDKDVSQAANEAKDEVYRYALVRDYQKHGLVLYGPVGTGKTRCAVSVLRRAAQDGKTVHFQPMAEIIGQFFDKDRGRKYVEALLAKDVVLFDDMDKLSLEAAAVKEQVFKVIDRLINDKRCFVATTNLRTPQEFTEKFGEAVVSRLVGACRFVVFDGEDYRFKIAERRG